jgi:predicted nuclease with RNAse H fold
MAKQLTTKPHEEELFVLGVDLSGPAGIQNTGVVVFAASQSSLDFMDQQCDGSDASLYSTVEGLSREGAVTVGLDAPLSYELGGGERGRDAQLRKEIVARGMYHGSVMAPTAPRMVYLTLRGVVLAQILATMRGKHQVRVVEVHPGASLCFRGAPLDAIRGFAADELFRQALLGWLPSQRVCGLKILSPCSSHFVAACAGAVAAWDWHYGRSRWLVKAEPPWHPYDFAS